MKRHQKLMGIAALGAAFALVMSGCAPAGNGGGNSGEGEAQTVEGADYNPQPRENLAEGGELRIPISNIAEQLNYFHSDGDARVTQVGTWFRPQILLMDPDAVSYTHLTLPTKA